MTEAIDLIGKRYDGRLLLRTDLMHSTNREAHAIRWRVDVAFWPKGRPDDVEVAHLVADTRTSAEDLGRLRFLWWDAEFELVPDRGPDLSDPANVEAWAKVYDVGVRFGEAVVIRLDDEARELDYVSKYTVLHARRALAAHMRTWLGLSAAVREGVFETFDATLQSLIQVVGVGLRLDDAPPTVRELKDELRARGFPEASGQSRPQRDFWVSLNRLWIDRGIDATKVEDVDAACCLDDEEYVVLRNSGLALLKTPDAEQTSEV